MATKRDIFKRKLPIYMDKARVRQIDLAKAVGVSKGTVSCWINGKSFPRIDTIQRIADFLGCLTDDLLFETVDVKIIGYSDDKQTKEMNDYWFRLNSKNKKLVFDLMKSLIEGQENSND